MYTEVFQQGYVAFKVKSFAVKNPFSKEKDPEKWEEWDSGYYWAWSEENED